MTNRKFHHIDISNHQGVSTVCAVVTVAVFVATVLLSLYAITRF